MAVRSSRRVRVALVVVFAILAVSTGVAAFSMEEKELVAGHTTYLRVVRTSGNDDTAQASPVDYGLATLREVRLFGLVARDRPVDESADRWVFAWSEGAPDPRAASDLVPTGDQAQVRDRYGAFWDVHEYRYAEGRHYTYAVQVGEIHLPTPGMPLPTGIDPEQPAYNYAITYRAERLFPDAYTEDGRLLPATAGLAEGDAAAKLTVRFGLGEAPPENPADADLPFFTPGADTPATVPAAAPRDAVQAAR